MAIVYTFTLMEYNTQRTPLYLPEYGRMVQSLVEHCKTLATKEERNEMASAIVEFISQRNPHLKSDETGNQKLWDHLFILANFDLDIDSPYPKPTPESLYQKPNRLAYPSYDDQYKFYGKSITQLIDRAIELEDGDEKEALIQVIANNMKKAYNIYNKEHVQDEVIFRHLKALSNDKLDLTGIDSLDKSKIYYSSNNRKNNNNHKNNYQKRKNFQNHKNKRN